MTEALDYLTYENLVGSNCTKELLYSDKWDFTFNTKPKAVYWPGDEFIKFRVKSISGISLDAFMASPVDGPMIRGFQVPSQPGMQELTEQDVTFNMVDFEDQSILVFFMDWAFKCCDPMTKKGFRSEDLRASVTYTRLNVLGQPVREYKQVNAIISSYSYADDFEDSRSLLGSDISFTLKGVVLPPKFMNLA